MRAQLPEELIANQFVNTLKDFVHEKGTVVVADTLGVTRPTIQRWLLHKNLPYPSLQKILIDYMRKV